MKYLFHIVTRYPLSCLLITLIWVLCFCTPPHTQLDHVKAIDKWTHTAMYLVTCLTIWIEYLRRHRKTEWPKVLTWAWLAPMAMGGVIELLQAYCTDGRRSGEWLDAAANATGATLGMLIGILLARWHARGQRGCGGAACCRNGRRPSPPSR